MATKEAQDYDNFARWLRGTPAYTDEIERCMSYRRVFESDEAMRVLRDIAFQAQVFQPAPAGNLERIEGRRDIFHGILTALNQDLTKLKRGKTDGRSNTTESGTDTSESAGRTAG